MKHLKNESSAPIKIDGNPVSDDKFSTIIERRLVSRLRKALPKEGTPHLILTDKISEHALKRALKRPHKLSFDSLNIQDDLSNTMAYLLMPWTAEDLVEGFLEGISLGLSRRPLPANHIPLWMDVSDTEAAYYAKLRGLEWESATERKHLKAWMPVLDEHMVFGMARTIDNLNYFND